jgi:hypothetical protein
MKKLDLDKVGKYVKKVNYAGPLRPTRDWLVMLMVSAAFIVVSIGWNLWMFNKVTRGDSLGTETAAPVEEGVRVDRVNAIFEKRATEEARYLSEYHFVDPSR